MEMELMFKNWVVFWPESIIVDKTLTAYFSKISGVARPIGRSYLYCAWQFLKEAQLEKPSYCISWVNRRFFAEIGYLNEIYDSIVG